MKKMTASKLGLRLIKDFEGLRLDAYKCPANVWTIGYGHTKGVKQGMVIDHDRADELLIEDIAPIERQLNALCINFRQEQFDALVSWIFNLGAGNFQASTLMKKICDDASDEDIAKEFTKWIYAAKKPLVGLMKRRVAEANMFVGYDLYYFDEKNKTIKKK